MHICVTSIVRDAEPYLERYIRQICALRDCGFAKSAVPTNFQLTLAICEGDSTDGTAIELVRLRRYLPWIQLTHFYHRAKKFGSTDHPDRWRTGAMTWNYLYDKLPECDKVLYVEADLIWEPYVLWSLLSQVSETIPAVSCMVWYQGRFYDSWGHRGLDGKNFSIQQPYHPDLVKSAGTRFKISSAGSVIAMRYDVAKVCRFREADAMIGHDIYDKGFSLWLDPTLGVNHPE